MPLKIQQPCRERSALFAWMFVTVCLSSVSSTWAIPTASFQGLGDLPDGSFFSRANGVSADGVVVVGRGWSSTGFEAFLWTEAGGLIGLGDLPGGSLISSAIRVSADGSVVVGLGESSTGGEAFCWTAANGIIGLGDLPGGVVSSIAFAASADGSVVVGNSASTSGINEAFRWTETGGMVGLGDLSGGIFKSTAHDVSADGSVVVGRGNSAPGVEAYRWTQADGMVGLGFLTTASPFSQANAVSPDGLIVVGESHSDLGIPGNEAIRWTAETGMVGLGSLPAASSNRALAVSVSGVVIVGDSTIGTGTQAFIWDATLGIRNLQDVMINDFGLDLTGWTLLSATGISNDGQTIVGTGINPSGDDEAWIAFLPLPDADGDGIPDIIDACLSTPLGEPIDTVGCGCVTEDTSKPTVICPVDMSLSADPGACSASNVNLVMPTASDNCGVASVIHDAPVAFSVGDTIVTWTVTDTSGNTATCQQMVSVTDDEAPTLVCAAVASLSTDAGSCIASSVNLVSPPTSDNCGVAMVTHDAPMTLPRGDTMVTWTVTDTSGNATSCQQTVTVTDDESPVITVCPVDQTVSTDPGACAASIVQLVMPETSDNCGVDTITHDAPDTFAAGETLVTWTVIDTSGNTTTCQQRVTVTDNEPPTITACPADLTISTDPGVCMATSINLGIPVAIDNCSVDSITNDASGPFIVGDTTVTWTVSDMSGNTATCQQRVTVTDDEPPAITSCPQDLTVSADPNACTASSVQLVMSGVSDNCGVDTITHDAPDTFAVGETMVTWTVTDMGGNTAICQQKVTVIDNESPAFTLCPQDLTVSADPGGCMASAVNLSIPATSDNCGVDTLANDAPDIFNLGDTTVTWTVTDMSGNATTCQQTVAVMDDESPVITVCPTDRMLTADANCQARVPDLVAETGVRDNCDISPILTQSPTPGMILDLAGASIEIKATDTSGNASTCTVLITVDPNGCNTPPDRPPPQTPPQGPVNTDPGEPEFPQVPDSDTQPLPAPDCGSGMCGPGSGMMMPMALLWIGWMRRRR